MKPTTEKFSVVGFSFSVNTAKYSGFYTIYRRDELRTKERKIEQWHLLANS